jgi:hypothetical protein
MIFVTKDCPELPEGYELAWISAPNGVCPMAVNWGNSVFCCVEGTIWGTPKKLDMWFERSPEWAYHGKFEDALVRALKDQKRAEAYALEAVGKAQKDLDAARSSIAFLEQALDRKEYKAAT